MCGIIGVVNPPRAVETLYEGLTLLQHRGQDAAGIATVEGGCIHLHKSLGLVREVFAGMDRSQLRGAYGIGHCRYPTAGTGGVAQAQPLLASTPLPMALAHNGNLVRIGRTQVTGLGNPSDSEMLLRFLLRALSAKAGGQLDRHDLFAAVTQVQEQCHGGYAVVAAVPPLGLLAFRDPWGIRPLMHGSRTEAGFTMHAVASESAALRELGYSNIRDCVPGECLLISPSGELHSRGGVQTAQGHAPCAFEYVYLAHPDSVWEGISVCAARARLGASLAGKIRQQRPDHDIDAVIPVPFSGAAVAAAVAQGLQRPLVTGFVADPAVGRTFLMPTQGVRARAVRRKLQPVAEAFHSKNVLLVDDSIVRGNSARWAVHVARAAGARRVYFASSAPPVRYPNLYGIDLPAAGELIAAGRSEPEIGKLLQADWLVFQELDKLHSAVLDGHPALRRLEDSCFSGRYVIDPGANCLARLATVRGERSKAQPAPPFSN